jgi:hypothetical protein
MRGGIRLLAVLTIGGVVSAAGAVVIDMPPSPAVARIGADPTEPSGTAPPQELGDVALQRYARARHEPSYTHPASPAWWGWPYGRFWYGYGLAPSWGWGWFGWGRPYHGFSLHRCGYGFRQPYGGGSRFRVPYRGARWRGARFTFRGHRR